MCNSEKLDLFLDLGFIPKVDRFLTINELNLPEMTYPLKTYFCQECGLAQLGFVVPKEDLFNENYAYESSTTNTRKKNHEELADYVCKNFNIKKKSLVVDIGSNVGMLLQFFKDRGMNVLGIDASENIVEKANQNGIETWLGFFEDGIVERILKDKEKASVITATNVFAHIQNYEQFIDSLKNLLSDDGVFVFQVPHFLQLLKNVEYDTIYHEHISYFGIKPLITFFEKFNMELFDVIETDIDGGSLRCFVANKGKHSVSERVKNILEKEENEEIYSIKKLKEFAEKVKNQKILLLDLLLKLKRDGKKVVGIGAPAKGMTMINYCKIDSTLIEYITEKSGLKIGKFTPGMHISVKSDDEILKDMPDYAIIFSWNFAKEIMENLKEYKEKGGKFIIPIPIPKIV